LSTDCAFRTIAAIEAPPTEQEKKEAVADFEDWITTWVTKYGTRGIEER
jgi:hypothetical protein